MALRSPWWDLSGERSVGSPWGQVSFCGSPPALRLAAGPGSLVPGLASSSGRSGTSSRL